MKKAAKAGGYTLALLVAALAVGLGWLAASPSARTVWFGNFWLAWTAHGDDMHDHRVALMNQVSAQGGRVLEVGPGNGLNLQILLDQHQRHHHQKQGSIGGLPQLTWEGMEPNPVLYDALRQLIAQSKADNITAHASPLRADEFLEGVADESYDGVISTLVLCTVPEPPKVLKELKRVLKPGGKMYFLEHVGFPRGTTHRKFQEYINPVWGLIGDGCETDRDTLEVIQAAGFATVDAKEFLMDNPVMKHIVGRMIIGVATK